jgi:hypothetical protein
MGPIALGTLFIGFISAVALKLRKLLEDLI